MKVWNTKSGYRIIQILSGRSNVFLLTNGSKNILIDTSPNYMWSLLVKRLNKLKISKIDALILTHSHMDHAENSCRIKEKYGSFIIIHRSEASYLASGNNIIPHGTNLFTRTLMKALSSFITPLLRYKPCQFDVLVDDKFELDDFGFNARIIHTPGHTIGSVSVVIDDEVAIVGDTMFGIFSSSAFPPYADDVRQMMISWRRLLDTNCSVFIPGHGSANSRSLVQSDYDRRERKYHQKAG